MSVIVDVGHRRGGDTMWFRFRQERIYSGETAPSELTDEEFVTKRDIELGKIGAKWIDVTFDDDTTGKFKLEFDNDVDATAFVLRWS